MRRDLGLGERRPRRHALEELAGPARGRGGSIMRGGSTRGRRPHVKVSCMACAGIEASVEVDAAPGIAYLLGELFEVEALALEHLAI